jgi:hypothetical protein
LGSTCCSINIKKVSVGNLRVVILFVVLSVIGLGIPVVTKRENDLITDGTIKLENGGSKTGNFLAKLLVILILVVIVLLFVGDWATNT